MQTSKKRPWIMKKKIWLLAVILFVIFDASVAGFIFFNLSKTKGCITVEAGSIITPEDFDTHRGKEVYFADGSKEIVTSETGTFEVVVNADGFKRTCKYNVVDTIPPQVELKELSVSVGSMVVADDFIVEIKDAGQTEAFLDETIQTNQTGNQEIRITVKDDSDNVSILFTTLHVVPVDLVNHYTWEAGKSRPLPQDFLTAKGECEYHGAGLSFVNFAVPGVYPVYLLADNNAVKVSLEIVDTAAPQISVYDEYTAYLSHPIEPSKLVSEAIDETQITYEFETEPDWENDSIEGFPVTIVATDLGNNVTKQTSTLKLIKDEEPPYIIGAGNISIVLGETVSYRNGVSAYDNCDGEIEFSVDNKQVDLSVIGTYHVIYSATDSSGNTVTQDVRLTVMPERAEGVTLDMLNVECDRILGEILTPGMTQYEQAEAIFNWIRGHVYFISDSQKDDWILSAYDAIKYGKGDCYNFASISKALLTRAGIPNIDIKRNSTLSKHFWNLVDTGEGWYHFDTTPRQDKKLIFMMSESELCADEAIRRSHVYDKSLYPEVNME